MISKDLLSFGEVIHGSKKEKEIMHLLKEKFSGTYYEIKTKEWVIKEFHVYVNGKEINATLLPYTSGEVEGIVGKDVAYYEMPSHPFMVKDLYDKAIKEGYKAVIFYDKGKLRRISVGNKIPAIFVASPLRQGDRVKIVSNSNLVDITSYNLESIVKEGADYVIIGVHVDHWLTGYHDNLFSLSVVENLNVNLKNHGLKYIFFSSEEGPRCCTGSYQHPKENTFVMISLDALYPPRVVFSSTPDLFQFSKYFNLKRVEMPTPFSDHFPYVFEGYPGMVLYNDDLIPYYHSDQDLPIEGDEEYLKDVVNGLTKMLIELDKFDKKALDNLFFNYAREQGFNLNERKGSIVPKGLTSTFKT